jgi:SUMO ligase MMS21 Smc5/6 complex component
LSSTPSSLSPPVDPFFDSEQLLGIFNTFEQNFFEEDDSKLKVIKPNNEIINTIKKLYIDKNETCPITYESLTIETISITSCYHVFNKDAITNWFKTKNNCPVCRERCEIW